MTIIRGLAAALAAMVMGGAGTLPAAAAESVSPRVYTAQDCQDLLGQLADSMRNTNLDAATAASIQQQQARAERSCNSGQYAAGTRQLRDLLDRVIAARP